MSDSDCRVSGAQTAAEVAVPDCTMSRSDAPGLMQIIIKLSDCQLLARI